MSTDTAGLLTLGFMTDPADASTFTAIDDVPSNNYATQRFVMHSFKLGNYSQCANMNARLAFRWTDASTAALSTVCIDDITVRVKLDCEEPTDVHVYAISDNSVTIDWTPGNSSQTEWEIYYNGTTVTATTHPFSLSGLTHTTEYTIQVRTVCGTDDVSYWSTPCTFRTACPAITVDDENPYTETFTSNILDCWLTNVTSGSDDWGISTSAHSGSYGVTYSNSMFGDLMNNPDPDIMDFFSMFGGMTDFGTGSSYLISPIMDLTALTMPARLTFYRRQVSSMVPLTLQVGCRAV